MPSVTLVVLKGALVPLAYAIHDVSPANLSVCAAKHASLTFALFGHRRYLQRMC